MNFSRSIFNRNSRALLLGPAIILSLTAELSLAKSLTCEMRINQKTVLTKNIETQKNKKIKIGTYEGITAYLTEKDQSFYSSEGFVPQYELRFYGEGVLKTEKDQIISSLWGREILIENVCKLNSVKNH